MADGEGGRIIEGPEEGPQADTASARSLLEAERARRAQATQEERAAAWRAAMEREGLWPLMQVVEQRLAELPDVLAEHAGRQALAPRLVNLAQDVLAEGLGAAWSARVHALHREVTAECGLVGNAAAARTLLQDIARFTGYDQRPDRPDRNGILPADPSGWYRGWRQQLTWYVHPLPPASADRLTREVERLESEVVAAIRQRQEADRGRAAPRRGDGALHQGGRHARGWRLMAAIRVPSPQGWNQGLPNRKARIHAATVAVRPSRRRSVLGRRDRRVVIMLDERSNPHTKSRAATRGRSRPRCGASGRDPRGSVHRIAWLDASSLGWGVGPSGGFCPLRVT